ncbi:MAG: hypothetical protein ACO1OB_01010 [Archangium sp.]
MRWLCLCVVTLFAACPRAMNLLDGGQMELPPEQDVAPENGDGVSFKQETVNGIAVNTYTWTDSGGKPRTVSLKREGSGNAGHGGYAVQFTYEVNGQTVRVDGTQGGEYGFGFFVGHERTRKFDDGSESTIAAKHGEDDSPLGLSFGVTSARSTIAANSTVATHTFTTSYPKWGTAQPMANVDDDAPAAANAHQRFEVPVTIRWVFAKGTDYPRIDFTLDLSASQPGQLAFDVRGPYGTVEFANSNGAATLHGVQWGDSAFHFTTKTAMNADLTTNSAWSWDQPIGTSRKYNALIAKGDALYEIGLVEKPLAGETGLAYGGWADTRGMNSLTSGRGLLSNEFPGWQWPFQSAQYSGLSANASSTFKKFAWGSSNLYGSANVTQFLNNTISVPLVPHPDRLTYRTCLVLGVSTYDTVNFGSLTRTEATAVQSKCPAENP